MTKPFDKAHGGEDSNKDECCEGKWGHWSNHRHHHNHSGGMMGGCFYFFAFIGIAIYNVQQVSGFGPGIVAVLKAIVWPAFLMYKVFTMLHM